MLERWKSSERFDRAWCRRPGAGPRRLYPSKIVIARVFVLRNAMLTPMPTTAARSGYRPLMSKLVFWKSDTLVTGNAQYRIYVSEDCAAERRQGAMAEGGTRQVGNCKEILGSLLQQLQDLHFTFGSGGMKRAARRVR